MSRPLGAQNRDKPFREALRMEIAAAGEDHKELREIARALIAKAKSGDAQAIKEIADRLDGKPAQFVTDNAEDFEAFMSDHDLASELMQGLAELGPSLTDLALPKPNGKAH